GGCAMNSVANGKIRERTPFTDVYIQPAAGDNGTALGAAYWVWHEGLHRPRTFVMKHAYFGPAFSREAVEQDLAARAVDLRHRGCTSTPIADEGALCDEVA